MGSKQILAASIVVALVFIGLVVTFNKAEPEPVTLPIQVEEFSDFECPACKSMQPVAQEIKSMDDVEFTYKHFPLEQIHKRAYAAAVASEAAREQGKFDEYHDILFENQPDFSDEELIGYAEELEMDVEKFRDDYENNQALKDRVDADMAEGEGLRVNATPTFVINGEVYNMLGKTPEDLTNHISDLIDQAKENES